MRRTGRSAGKLRRVAGARVKPCTAMRVARGLRLILSRRRDQLFQLQFQLIKEPLAAFGARTEHLALHLGDHQLQVLDQRLGTHQLGACLDQRRLQRVGIFGKRICDDRIIISSDSQA